jgi:hypothetical protein
MRPLTSDENALPNCEMADATVNSPNLWRKTGTDDNVLWRIIAWGKRIRNQLKGKQCTEECKITVVLQNRAIDRGLRRAKLNSHYKLGYNYSFNLFRRFTWKFLWNAGDSKNFLSVTLSQTGRLWHSISSLPSIAVNGHFILFALLNVVPQIRSVSHMRLEAL